MGLQGSWERSCGIGMSDPGVEQIPEQLWERWQRKQPGAERTSAERWSCRSCQVNPGTGAGGLAMGHTASWTKSPL